MAFDRYIGIDYSGAQTPSSSLPGLRMYHQHDAYSIAAWMRRADLNGSLTFFVNVDLEDHERTVAEIEGWILGVL